MTSPNRKDQTSFDDGESGVELFDPFKVHFISQNQRNDFVKALEDNREYTYEAMG